MKGRPYGARAALAAAILAASVIGAADAGAQQNRRNRDRDRDGQRMDTTFAFAAGGALEIELPNMQGGADVVVTGWARNEVRVDAETDEGEIDVDVGSRTVIVRARNSFGAPRVERLHVSVPHGTRVRVGNTGGDIQVTGTRGAVDVTTFNGDITVSDVTDRLDVKTFNGDVGIAKVDGRIVVSASNGDLTLDDVRGDISVNSLNGDIELSRVTSSSVKAKTMSGEITYDGTFDSSGQYSFDAFSGAIDIVMPSNVGATLTVSTYSGTIDSDFALTLRPSGQSRSSNGKSMTFTLGNGGARVSLESFSGEIRIRERRAGTRQ